VSGGYEAIPHGPCVICGAPGTQSFFASRPFLTRTRVAADGSEEQVSEPIAPVHVCQAHFVEVFSERLPIGYCAEPSCRRWGPLGEASPCGVPYVELWPEDESS